jgi:cell division septum initiation protein DivIVA
MELTSYQAETVRFSQVRRGFDPDEVTRFQRRVARVLAEYERETAAARDQIARLERQRDGARSDEAAARQTYLAAARTKDELVAEAARHATELRDQAATDAAAVRSQAEREAEELLDTARREAAAVERRSTDEVARLRRRMAQLRTAVSDIEDRMRVMAERTLAETHVVADLIALETEDFRNEPTTSPSPEPDGGAASEDISPSHAEPSFYERRLRGLRDRLDSTRS